MLLVLMVVFGGACDLGASHGRDIGSISVDGDGAEEVIGKGIECLSEGHEVVAVQDGEVLGRVAREHEFFVFKPDPDGGDVSYYCDDDG